MSRELNSKWLSYDDATALIRSRDIKSWKELNDFISGDDCPSNFPSRPSSVYGGHGWKSSSEFFGCERVWNHKKEWHKKEWMEFNKARVWARGLGLKTKEEWKAYCETHELPKGISKAPECQRYQEWDGYFDWLVKSLPTYGELKEWVHTNGIKGRNHYNWYYQNGKLPEGYPCNPEEFYKNRGTWVNWDDLTGGGLDYRDCLGYEEAKEITRTLGMTQAEYLQAGKGRKLLSGLPLNPDRYYTRRGTWKGWGDYIGTTRHDRGLDRRELVRPLVQSLVKKHLIVSAQGLRNKLAEMKEAGENTSKYIVCPEGMDEDEWLGTKDVVEELVKRVKGMGITSDKDWNQRVRDGTVDSVVRHTLSFYRRFGYEGKTLFGDTWEPSEVVVPKVPILSYMEALPIAREFCKGHRIDTCGKWHDLEEGMRPAGLPSNPDSCYKGCGWKGWKEWTGRLWDNTGGVLEQIDTSAIDTSNVHVMQVDGRCRVTTRGAELWRPVSFISGFETCLGYMISTHGRVYNRWKGEIVSQHEVGHVTRHLVANFNELKLLGKTPGVLVHRLVAMEFIPNLDRKPMVNHIDSNPQNNDISNLEWVTARENNYHAILSGAKESALSAEIVSKVKLLLRQGKRIPDISAATGLSRGTIQNINLGKTYKWIGAGQFEYPIQGRRKKVKFRISDEKKREILEMRRRGISFRVIAERVGLSKGTVYSFIHHDDRSRESVPMVHLSALKIVDIHQKNPVPDMDAVVGA